MNKSINNYITSRIIEIEKNMLDTDGEYAVACEESEQLYINIEPILMSELSELTIDYNDILELRKYFNSHVIARQHLKQKLYKQGYLDCIYLLKQLGCLN